MPQPPLLCKEGKEGNRLAHHSSTASAGRRIRQYRLLRYLLGLRLVLVRDIQLDRSRRTLRKVLIAMNRAARDIDVIAGLHNAWLLTLDRESDFAFLHRPPLVSRVSMELVAGTRRNDDVLQTHDARWILFERHHEIRLRLETRCWRLGRLRLPLLRQRGGHNH